MMPFKQKICLLVLLGCFLPSLALAKSYKCMDIYDGTLNTGDIVFQAGDEITGGSGIDLELYYVDADENKVDEGKGKIKSVNINGKKCSEWVMSGCNAAVIQIGRRVQGSFGFTMKPAYTAADSEGYYMILTDTYNAYLEKTDAVKERKVKLSGSVADIKDKTVFVSVGDEAVVAVEVTEISTAIGDKVLCKGQAAGSTRYNGTDVPLVACEAMEVREYEPLKQKDKGEEVLQMKERLRDLGYFNQGAELSDEYNTTCAERVKLFQENNGLTATGQADIETLTLLYSESAKTK